MTSDPVIYAALILVALAGMMAVETAFALTWNQKDTDMIIFKGETAQDTKLKNIC
jgi:hypothetical protein